MAVAQHTPGPWLVEEDDSLNGVPFIPVAGPYGDIPNGRSVAEVSASLDEASDRFRITDEDRANARLTAAAPDLLAALKAMNDAVHDLRPSTANLRPLDKALRMAGSAIAKVEGL